MRFLGLACVVLLLACGNVREEPADAPVTPGGDGPIGNGDGPPPPLPDADCTMGGAPELCNGIDDNCNDMIDEDFVELGQPCDGADGDICEEGVFVCRGDGTGTVCDDATADNAEVCNSLDDDCDGVGDNTEFNLGAVCDGPDGDQCDDGTRVCDQAMVGAECFDPGPDLVEVCNGLNDDCDSATDEGTCPSGERCAGTSGACVCDTMSGCTGCCGLSGTQCFGGTSAQQCGINGQVCFTCGNNSSHCENGVCRCGNGTPCSGFQPVCCSGGPGEPKVCISQTAQCP